jgi:hypothetical protein
VSLQDITRRAAKIKADPKLRHLPNEKDLRVFSEHARLMQYPQYQTIKPDKERQK